MKTIEQRALEQDNKLFMMFVFVPLLFFIGTIIAIRLLVY